MNHNTIPDEVMTALAAGDVPAARNLLGHPFQIRGMVVHGNHIGRTLGFPTANIAPDVHSQILLQHGVYLVETVADDHTYYGLANVGIRPTINGTTPTVEVHLLGYSGDLYGQSLTTSFLQRIREERKFSNLQELADQISRDKKQALSLIPRSD